MRTIIYQPSDVFLGHLWKLLLENAFEAGKDNQALSLVVIIDNSKLDVPISLFYDRRLPA